MGWDLGGRRDECDSLWRSNRLVGVTDIKTMSLAYGRTAYRLWTGEDPPNSPATANFTPSSPSIPTSSIRSRPDSIEYPPPPAYTELLQINTPISHESRQSTAVGEDEEEDSWIDVRDPTLSPLSYIKAARISPVHTIRHGRHRSRPSKSSLRRIRVTERKVVDISIEDINTTYTDPSHDPFASKNARRMVPITPRKQTTGVDVDRIEEQRGRAGSESQDADEDEIDPLEIMYRLDTLGEAMNRMIEEGKKALADPSPVLASEGWTTESKTKSRSPERRRSCSKSVSISVPGSSERPRACGGGAQIPPDWKRIKRRSMGSTK